MLIIKLGHSETLDYAVVTLEEHSEIGGVGESIAAFLAKRDRSPRLCVLALALKNKFCNDYGSQEYVLKANGLDIASLIKRIRDFMRTIGSFKPQEFSNLLL